MPVIGSQLWHNTFSTVDNINFIKWIANLGPVKQLHVVYLTVILVLGTVVVRREERSDKISEKSEKKYDDKQSKVDSLQAVLILHEKLCGERLGEKDQQMMDHLKQDILDQRSVKNRIKQVERKADNVISDTKDKLKEQ